MAASNALLSKSATRAWQVRKSVLGTIYAFATADGVHVKIGFTTDLQKRLNDLSKDAGYYGEFDGLVGSAFGTFAEEMRIHSALNGRSLWSTQRRRGPREMYPVSVLGHPACRAIFGAPSAAKKRKAA